MAKRSAEYGPRRKGGARTYDIGLRAPASVAAKRSRTPRASEEGGAARKPKAAGGNGGALPRLPEPTARTLKVYALDPSAGNYIGNVMTVRIRWERNLKPGPVGRRFAVIDYDAANHRYYPPVDLDDYRILARGGLDPSESDPRFHQQMVYAVASETVEKFEAALGRTVHWHRADRSPRVLQERNGGAPFDDIWVLKLFPHAMVQANAFYSREARGILFGYFRASDEKPGNNLPGQRVFTCLSHDIIAHEVTHAVIDGIRTRFTEPSNPDVLAFHEAFADLTALFLHFSHKEALLDTIRKTGGRLYPFELKPDAAPLDGRGRTAESTGGVSTPVGGAADTPNPLVQLARQFGDATGMGRGLRAALDTQPDPEALNKRINDPHFRGSILVAAVFDAYFTTYLRAAADLFRIYRAGGGQMDPAELPTSLASLLTEAACKTADDFFQLCARALDYCPPVDITFGDFLRALVTVSMDFRPDDRGVRQALMQAFRVRGIYPESASFFSEEALSWAQAVSDDELPPVSARIADPETGASRDYDLIFGRPDGLTDREQDLNGAILREYARRNAARLGFDASPQAERPDAPSFHQVFRVTADGRLRIDMVVELIQTRRVPFDPEFPQAGTFPLRGGVTLIIAAPQRRGGRYGPPRVRFSIGKPLTGHEGELRAQRQRTYAMSIGLMNGDTEDPRHFQADFGLVHQGM
jgi:hypothetical protein